MSVSLLQLISQASCRDSDAYSKAKSDPCRKARILVVAQRFLSYSPNASEKAVRNVSKLLRKRDLASNSGANQDNACPLSRVPTMPTRDLSIEYCCG